MMNPSHTTKLELQDRNSSSSPLDLTKRKRKMRAFPSEMTLFLLGFSILLQSLSLALAETPAPEASTETRDVHIPIGNAQTKKPVIALFEINDKPSMSQKVSSEIRKIMEKDLGWLDQFKLLDRAAFLERGSSEESSSESKVNYSLWTKIQAEYLVRLRVEMDATRSLTVHAELHDTFNAKPLWSKRFVGELGEVRTISHTLSNEVVEKISDLPGIFLTRIAMVCDKTGKKEIYTMNFDGSEPRQITRHRSLTLSPAWSADGTKIAYSLVTRHRNNIKNIDLYELDLVKNKSYPLSNRSGMINSGAAYSPDGKKLAFTLSENGHPSIFIRDLVSGKLTPLLPTKKGDTSIDVDPNWSPDSKNIVFTSSRKGPPMIFTALGDGSSAQPERLTFAGRLNGAPSWSPMNNKIAFAGWTEKRFDLFMMNPDGTRIDPLTGGSEDTTPSNNEDPSFSPDGNFIVFTSNRAKQKNIYVMNVDGTFTRRLTYGLGNCVSPKWSLARSPFLFGRK